MRISQVISIIVLLSCAQAKASRVTYLEQAIQAFRASEPRFIVRIKDVLEWAEKQKCRSLFGNLTLNCLQKESQKFCSSGEGRAIKNCQILTDVTLVNKLNEKQFLSREERYHILETSTDYKRELARGLAKKYALLSTQMILFSKKQCAREDTECLAGIIDNYCLKNADGQNLAWQACASAIAWFVGISKP